MKKFYDNEIVTIEKLVQGGKGLGFFKEKPVFVPYTLPGEKVRVQILRYKSKVYDGKLLEVLEPSPNRVTPPCPYFGECGGCQWQHMTYETQLKLKQVIIRETLERIGEIGNPNVLATLGSPQPFGWRSRVTFHGNEKGEIGFYAPNSHRVIDIEKCLIVEEEVNQRLEKIRSQPTEVKNRKRDYEVRSTDEKGFTQVNREQNETLKKVVFGWAEKLPHDHLVELFCGSGNFTEGFIPLAKKCVAVDCSKEAIEVAKKKYPETKFVCTDAIRYFAHYRSEIPLDLLVLDPPRDGAAGVVEGVIQTKPKNILYISCHPATLARDLKFLKEFAGYQLMECQPIDMFPQSHHVETVSWISY